MSEGGIRWKIRVKQHQAEVEVIGMTKQETRKMFDELAKEYFP